MKSHVLELAEKLIQIPSVSGDERQNDKVLALARRELKGFNVRTFQKNGVKSLLFHTGKKATGRHTVLLNAHLDVVPGKPEQFVPKIKGNKLYGRGAYDMKSGAAALIHLFKDLAPQVSYDLALQLVTDEEIGGENGTGYQLEKGVSADFVIAGENSDLLIDNQSKGIVRVRLTATGKSSHGAYPWLGDNAILKLIKGINAVLRIYPLPRKEVWRTTVNLAHISTNNTALNKVPEDAETILDIRYIPREKESIIQTIQKTLPKGVQMDVLRIDPPTFTDEQNPYVQSLMKSIKIISGRNAQCIAKHGSSDLRYYTAKGIPAVAFGPKGEGHHSDVEWVDIKSVNDYVEILKDFLLTI